MRDAEHRCVSAPLLAFFVTINGSYSDYVPLVNLIGVYFQIRDDYMNLQSTEVGALLFF